MIFFFMWISRRIIKHIPPARITSPNICCGRHTHIAHLVSIKERNLSLNLHRNVFPGRKQHHWCMILASVKK